MDWREDPKLPTEVRAVLGTLTDALRAALGDRLEALVLYGGLARGDEFYRDTTRVELLLVLRGVDAATLAAAAPAFTQARKRLRVTTMVVTRDDLRRSGDVFPVKFTDMETHQVVLHGEDPLAGCKVSREHLRLRCEQELRNLQLRLRGAYLGALGKDRDVLTLLGDMSVVFVDQLRHLLLLRAGQAPLTRADVVAAVEPLGIETAALEELLAIHRGRHRPKGDALRALVDRFLRAADRAASLADAASAEAV